jgi:hypothetical protein
MTTTTAPLRLFRYGTGWRVASASMPMVTHFVSRAPHWHCTCSAWVWGHGAPCRHIRAVREWLSQGRGVLMG